MQVAFENEDDFVLNMCAFPRRGARRPERSGWPLKWRHGAETAVSWSS